MYLKILEVCIKEHKLDPAHILSAPGLVWQACLKKTGIKLELLTDIDMFLMIEKEIRGGITHVIHRYAKANNKYLKNYDKNKQYLYANNLYGWTMSQKLPVDGFKWIETSLIDKKFNKFLRLMKNYDEESDDGYIFEVDIEYPKKLHDLDSNLQFLPERMKINKCSKLVCNLYNKKNYVVHIKTLKQALDHGLVFVHSIILVHSICICT